MPIHNIQSLNVALQWAVLILYMRRVSVMCPMSMLAVPTLSLGSVDMRRVSVMCPIPVSMTPCSLLCWLSSNRRITGSLKNRRKKDSLQTIFLNKGIVVLWDKVATGISFPPSCIALVLNVCQFKHHCSVVEPFHFDPAPAQASQDGCSGFC